MTGSRIAIVPKAYTISDWGDQLENSAKLLEKCRDIIGDSHFSALDGKVFVYSVAPEQVVLDGFLVQMWSLLESLIFAS
eukprot:gene12328-9793_t